MTTCAWKRLAVVTLSALVVAKFAAPANAQYRPVQKANSGLSTQLGENYHFEVAANFWNPDPSLVVAADGLNVSGSTVDAVLNLGIAKTRFTDIKVVLRPAPRHKLRLDYLPIQYSSTATLTADISFKGQVYHASTPVASDLQWKEYRISYEYDVISNHSGFLGLVLTGAVTDAKFHLNAQGLDGLAELQAPIPAIGGIGRVYLSTGFSVTGEVAYFKLPETLIKDVRGHYIDWDVSATWNLTNNFGAVGGYRKIDVEMNGTTVRGAAVFTGVYFGGVVRY
jgi:hypothetical protein